MYVQPEGEALDSVANSSLAANGTRPLKEAPLSAALESASSAEAVVIENSQQFLAWFAGVEALVDGEQEQAFRSYEDLLRGYSGQCAQVLSLSGD